MKRKYVILISIIILASFVFTTVIIVKERCDGKNKYKDLSINFENLNSYFEENGDFNLANMKDIDSSYIENTLNIPMEKINSYTGKIPIVNVNANMYIIIEAKEQENTNEIQEKLETFLVSYKKEWESFLLSEYDLLFESKVKVKGKYVYLIISENSKKLEDYISKN